LPLIAYRRLWLNEWTAGGGDALSVEVIEQAFRSDLQPQKQAQPGFEYIGGLDLGVSRDASALCILGVKRSHQGHGRIQLAHTKVWRPTKGMKVNLQAVEDEVLDLHDRFNLKALHYDPWQATYMSGRLQAGGGAIRRTELHKAYGKYPATTRIQMQEVPQTGANLQRMATVLLEAFNDGRLELYADADLKRDITRLRVEERPYGFRLVSPRDALGHGDLGTAFSLALLGASELATKRQMVAGPIDQGPLTPETIASNLTPSQQVLQQAWQQFDVQQSLFASEQESARRERQRQHDPTYLRQAMFRTGRSNVPHPYDLFF
jgi:phage terminase large subunit-like protein